jgi:hypothetical protein
MLISALHAGRNVTTGKIIPDGWSTFRNFRKLMGTIHILTQEHFWWDYSTTARLTTPLKWSTITTVMRLIYRINCDTYNFRYTHYKINVLDYFPNSKMIWNLCCTAPCKVQYFKGETTYFMFSTIRMLTKNRTSFKSSVATLKDEFLLWFDYLLLMSVNIWSPNNKIENRHFLFMWQQSKENNWMIKWTRRIYFLWYSNNINGDIPTRLQRKEYINIQFNNSVIIIHIVMENILRF